MRKLIYIVSAILLFVGCSNDSDSNTSGESIIVENINVKSFELVILTTQNSELLESYEGTFGNNEIIINKVDESSLAFLVPDVSQGNYSLNFDLGNIDFNVTETVLSNPQDTINNVFNGFNNGISNLDDTDPYIEQEIQNAMSYFSEVQDLYNSLSDEQKTQVALYYEANKETFQNFVNNTNLNIDASTVLSRVPQSQCPTTDFKSFYSCTAENLGESSTELTQSATEFLTMLGLAGTAIAISPATVGISLATAGIAVATAAYILIAETIPAAIQFKSSLRGFTRANWIFTQATFSTIVDVFTSETETNVNSQPTFRSLNENDSDVSTETSFFINSYSTLNGYWNSLSALFTSMPNYQDSFEIKDFDENTDQMNIANISNSNVELVSINGQNVTFKSLSGEDETFSFDIEIIKEGFLLSKTINNAIVSAQNEIDIAGVWSYNTSNLNCSNGASLGTVYFEFDSEGTVSLYPVSSGATGTGTYQVNNNILTFDITFTFSNESDECDNGTNTNYNQVTTVSYSGTLDDSDNGNGTMNANFQYQYVSGNSGCLPGNFSCNGTTIMTRQ